MHLAPIASRTAHRQSRLVRAVSSLVLVLLLAACATPEIIRETPQPALTPTTAFVPIETHVVPTSTPVVQSPASTIEQIAFATRVRSDGTPIDERSAIPESAETFYLCVRVREVEQGTRFQAIWFEGENIIGRSEKVALERATEPVWMSMQYRRIGQLNPSGDHTVELLIDNEPVERLVFRVGVGDPADAIAAAAFTTGFDNIGKAVNPQTYFRVETTELTLRVRVSNQVDPTGMLLSTLWYRDDTPIGQRAPNEGSNDPRRFDFTFSPQSPFAVGNYRVALLLNGSEVRSIPFIITNGELPTPTPEPTRTPSPGSGTRTPTTAEILEVVVASRINPTSQVPLDSPLREWVEEPEGVADLWVAMDVRNVEESDEIEIVVLQGDEFYGSVTLTETEQDSGWLTGRVELEAPSEAGESYRYTIVARLNGNNVGDTYVDITASSD